ncbi:MAG: rod shape-determining protein RodA [Parcubacteria group bacterium]|nr:rod shape-determining protein RodA [Parcubacteria group bacterium]
MDWPLLLAIAFLAFAGLLSLASANKALFWQQSVWVFAGLAVIFALARVDLRPFLTARWFYLGFFGIAIFLLVVTYFLAPPIRGARSWLAAGGLKIQTSELVKPALIVLYAVFFSRRHVQIARVRNLLVSFLYFAVPAFLIIAQPDLGTTMILFGIWFSFLLVSGVRWRHLLVALLIFALIAAAAWIYFLKDYQKERILGLFFPERDPLGINYNVIQSKIAIGSAGFFGKGFGQGTQAQLGFLPEAQTDFIFAAFVEEWGLFGGILIIGAFLLLIARVVGVGFESANNFGAFVCLGTAAMFVLHFLFNIGSNLGFFPVVGVPFPFFSYGGSSFLTNALLIGIIQQIKIRSSF